MKAGLLEPTRRGLITGTAALLAASKLPAYAECASGYHRISVPLCAATTPAFGSRPSSIWLEFHGQSNLVISNLFFNQFVVGADLLGFYGCNNITIADCDFDTMPVATAANRKAIYFQGCTGTLILTRCRSKQPAHDFMQMNTTHMVGEISHNKVRGATALTEDMISLFRSGGIDATHRLNIFDNHLDGGDPVTGVPGYTSSSGTGINVGDSALDVNTGFVDIHDNTVLSAGQAGIAVAGGNDYTIDRNILYSIQTATSNVGVSIWKNGGSVVCQNVEAINNRVRWLNSAGSSNGSFQNGNCGTIANWATNNFNDTTIDPAALIVTL